MKKIRIAGAVIFLLTLTIFVLWRFNVPFPDVLIRINGALMLAAVFTAVFSTVKISTSK